MYLRCIVIPCQNVGEPVFTYNRARHLKFFFFVSLLEFSLRGYKVHMNYQGILLKADSYLVGLEWGLPTLLQGQYFDNQDLKEVVFFTLWKDCGSTKLSVILDNCFISTMTIDPFAGNQNVACFVLLWFFRCNLLLRTYHLKTRTRKSSFPDKGLEHLSAYPKS